jgi:hypothetical protein
MTQTLCKWRGLPIALLLLFSLPSLHAQVRCGFDGTMNRLRKEHPGLEEAFNKKAKEFISKRKLTTARMTGTQAATVYIPVVVHVIHTGDDVGTVYNPTDAVIKGAIDYLNAVYNGTWTGAGGAILGAGDIGVQFVLATKDPSGNPSTGINRVNGSVLAGYATSGISTSSIASENQVKSLSRWDPASYYNVWVVNRIDGADGTVPGVPFVAGYAYFPMPNTTLKQYRDLDGIVMLATQMRAGQKTLPHEIGHALSLHHPFQGESSVAGANGCPANTSPYTQGDYCADTDPVINPADDYYGASAFSCRTGTNPCTNTPYTDNTEKNFMNYTNCYQLFTSNQRDRMQASAAVTNRSGLVHSWANNQGAYPTTWSAPVAPSVTPAFVSNQYADWMGILNISLNGKKVFTLRATQDGGYVDNAKWYNLFTLQPNTNYTMEVELLNSGNYEQVGLWIDYNGDGIFNDDAVEREFYTNDYYNPSTTAESARTSFSFTTPASLPGNIVRMRVMNDFSTRYGFPLLTGSSSSLVGGQAEDYPVYLVNTTPMPVTLLQFSGNTASGNTFLTWKTSDELNAKEYQVQRSTTGVQFSTIGVVKAKGTSSTETAYQYTDYATGSGTHFYRLKMVDQDGSFKYSNVLQFTTEAPSDVIVLGNPFTNSIRLALPKHNGAISLRLLDVNGKTLISRTLAGSQTTTIDLPVERALGQGLYILEVVVDGKRSVYKLVKE